MSHEEYLWLSTVDRELLHLGIDTILERIEELDEIEQERAKSANHNNL